MQSLEGGCTEHQGCPGTYKIVLEHVQRGGVFTVLLALRRLPGQFQVQAWLLNVCERKGRAKEKAYIRVVL